jgi:hypothetical protein
VAALSLAGFPLNVHPLRGLDVYPGKNPVRALCAVWNHTPAREIVKGFDKIVSAHGASRKLAREALWFCGADLPFTGSSNG